MPVPISRESTTSSTTEVRRPRQKRRVFSPAEKLRIVNEADKCNAAQFGELLRKEHIYAKQVASWKKTIAEHGVDGLKARRGSRSTTPESSSRLSLLERENRRLLRKLDLAHKLIELQKKVSELLNIPMISEE